MNLNNYKTIEEETVKNKILRLLHDKAPNSVRVKMVYELLQREDIERESIDEAIKNLTEQKLIVEIKRPLRGAQKYPAIEKELKKRDAIALPEYPKGMPIQGEYKIGNRSIVRLLSYDTVSGEDVNEITEALKEYIDNIDKTFDERVRGETAKIYRQMIGIFGVFVSIFAVVVIATDKMIRFDSNMLSMGWIELLRISSALFLPVGIVIALLVGAVLWGSRK